MDTRSITTSQPAVACDVCGRTLLRGEEPDLYLAQGERRNVCDLCGARAAHEGWLRESDGHEVGLRPARRRRGRGLMGRLRELREPTGPEAGDAESLGAVPPGAYAPEIDPHLAEAWGPEAAESEAHAAASALPASAPAPAPSPEARRTPRHVRGVPANSQLRAARALEVFNLGEGPRRVAGVARSLGAPFVAVRPLAEAGRGVSIVVGWELCWYRYEVDLAAEDAGAAMVAQGMELSELPDEDRVANAHADEHGELNMVEAPPPDAAA